MPEGSRLGCVAHVPTSVVGKRFARRRRCSSMVSRRVTHMQSGFRRCDFRVPGCGPAITSNWKPVSKTGAECWTYQTRSARIMQELKQATKGTEGLKPLSCVSSAKKANTPSVTMEHI